MARFSRIEVALKMKEQGMVPLFYHHELEVCKKLVRACYAGGARLLEFTNRGDYAHEIFGELNKYCAQQFPEMILGVGSITDAGTTSLFLQLGANFMVTPSLREDVAIICNRRKVLWVPGCATLTEIGQAESLGAEIVKLFPASVYGPRFIKAVKGPQPWTSIMPTGGVSPERENLSKWFAAGAYCVGMGSQLIMKDKNGQFDYEKIQSLTYSTLRLIQELKTS